MDSSPDSLYLVFVEFNPAKELKYKQNDIDNYNTWLYLRCNKHKPKIAPENTVAVGFASYNWLFNKGKMLGITIDGKLKMVDLTYRNYKIRPRYEITDGITKSSYIPDDSVYIENGNHKFTYYELHFMDLKRVTQYWNNIRSNPKKIPESDLEIELNLCHPNPMPYAYKDLIDTKGPKWASPYKNLIDIKGAEWAGYLADFPIKYCKDYDTLVTMALAKNKLYLNPDKGEPSMADGIDVQPGNGTIYLQVNGDIQGTFNVDQDWDKTIDLGNYSTIEPSNCTITIKSNGNYLGSFTLNQNNDSTIDIGNSSQSVADLAKALFKVNGETLGSIDFNKQTEYQTVNLDSLKAHDSTVKINYEDTNLGSFTTDQSNDSTIDISGINNLITKPNDNTVTIKANGSDIGSFTLNQNRDTTIDFGNLKPSDSKVSFSLNGNEIGSITLNQTNGSSIAFNGLATTDSVDTKLKTISTIKAYYSTVPEVTTIVTKHTSSEGTTTTYDDYTAPKPEGLVLGKYLYRNVNVVKSAGTGNNVAIYTIRYSNPLSYNDTDQYQCVNPSIVATTTNDSGSNINGTAGSFKEVIINTIDNTSFNVQ